MVLVGHQ